MRLPTILSFTIIALFSASVWAETAQPTANADQGLASGQQTGATTASDAQTPPAANPGSVARATFTSAIQEREPADQLSTLTNDNDQIYYFTELRGMAGHSVTHRWEHDGKVVAEVPFDVGGDRWRVYSSKRLDPSWTGEWRASVIDAAGTTLSVNTFSYDQAATAAGAATTPSAPAELKTQ
ncbi:MAG: hypothetical protein BMS9Abin36_1026 [Gammaproteobacteria bacterium]|nr:MAG: hypothetical protein BMS9Abin36_1026 [Gammaproteobacteria bacterium]